MLLYAIPCGCAWGVRLVRSFGLVRLSAVAVIISIRVDAFGWNMEAQIKLTSHIVCPLCRHEETETMPTDACQYFYDCKGCREVLKPKQVDCCVYCSYGDTACPPIQAGDACCS